MKITLYGRDTDPFGTKFGILDEHEPYPHGVWSLDNDKETFINRLKMVKFLNDEDAFVTMSFRIFTSKANDVYETDKAPRKPTVSEYARIGYVFSSFSHIYNKKKDEFTEVI